MPDYQPREENVEEYEAAKKALADEQAIWEEKFPNAVMGLDTFELGIKFNVLTTFLANTGVIDTDIFNIMVLKEQLHVRQATRAQIEEQEVKSNVILAPAAMADRFKKGKDQGRGPLNLG